MKVALICGITLALPSIRKRTKKTRYYDMGFLNGTPGLGLWRPSACRRDGAAVTLIVILITLTLTLTLVLFRQPQSCCPANKSAW
jgi:hypothetical protein